MEDSYHIGVLQMNSVHHEYAAYALSIGWMTFICTWEIVCVARLTGADRVALARWRLSPDGVWSMEFLNIAPI
jgi:hypothetical protein